METTPKPKMLLDVVRERIRAKHYAYSTEKTYVGWARAFVMHNGKRHPREINRLSKDASELRKDAERYRFLRACDIPAGAGGAHCIIKGQFGMTVGDGEDLDMAIDNAMSARGKQEKV